MTSMEGIRDNLKDLMQLEADTREVYRELSTETADEKVLSLMRWLIKEEERHRKLLEEAVEIIKTQGI